MSFVKVFLLMSAVQFGRYLVMAGLAYLFFWGWRNPVTEKNRIQKTDFSFSDLRREFGYSVLTCLIFGVVLGYAFRGVTFYDTFKLSALPFQTSAFYDFTSLAGLILIHDTYFYWMHRTLHHPKLFKRFHRVHHLSQNPSPWASLSFQPSEALLEIVWVPPVHALLPIQPYIWAIFGMIIIAINVLGHLGVEIYPRSWQNNPVLKWLNFSTYHNDHHHYFVGNYGLYLSFWDRVMGTLRQSEVAIHNTPAMAIAKSS